MKTYEAKQVARQWIESNRESWSGLRAAHLVGGINAMADGAEFPANKDVDIHVIFAAGSPQLQQMGPFPNLFEESFGGILIEAGPKSDADYLTAEVILVNPEIAHHLTVDSTLYDPDGWLAGLQAQVARDYAKRQWVLARLEAERTGFYSNLGLRPMATQMLGPSGEVNILGYAFTRVSAALTGAALTPLRVGGRMLLVIREILGEQDRLDLYERVLAVLGLQDVTVLVAQALLDDGAQLFDRAIQVRRTPHPFQHKMHAHLKPYFVDSCQGMIDEGFPREAAGWTIPFLLTSTDVLKVDGPEDDRAVYAARQDQFLRRLGLDTAERRDRRFLEAEALGTEIFALAEQMIAMNPQVVG